MAEIVVGQHRYYASPRRSRGKRLRAGSLALVAALAVGCGGQSGSSVASSPGSETGKPTVEAPAEPSGNVSLSETPSASEIAPPPETSSPAPQTSAPKTKLPRGITELRLEDIEKYGSPAEILTFDEDADTKAPITALKKLERALVVSYNAPDSQVLEEYVASMAYKGVRTGDAYAGLVEEMKAAISNRDDAPGVEAAPERYSYEVAVRPISVYNFRNGIQGKWELGAEVALTRGATVEPYESSELYRTTTYTLGMEVAPVIDPSTGEENSQWTLRSLVADAEG